MTPAEFKAWLKGYVEAHRSVSGYSHGERLMYDESVIDRILEEAEKIDAAPPVRISTLFWVEFPPPTSISDFTLRNDCLCPPNVVCNITSCPRAAKVMCS